MKNRISEEEDALKEVRRRDTESETEKRKYMRTCLHISTYMQIRTNRHVHVHTHTHTHTQISTEEQRQEIVDLGNETEDWLYDGGRTADVSEFKTKHNTIRLIL